jgi:hypothetical protein
MILAGLAIAATRWIYTAELSLTILSFTAAFLISIVLYACKVFGGADAKAMICVSLIIPQNISASLTPLFTLTAFLNTFILLGILYLTILTYNSLQRLKGEKLFLGLESESKWKKLVILLTGIRTDLNSLQNKKHFYPAQKIDKKNSETEIHLTSLRNIPTKESVDLNSLKRKMDEIPNKKIWVYFSKPLIPIITLAVILSFFLGDLPLFLLNLL